MRGRGHGPLTTMRYRPQQRLQHLCQPLRRLEMRRWPRQPRGSGALQRRALHSIEVTFDGRVPVDDRFVENSWTNEIMPRNVIAK